MKLFMKCQKALHTLTITIGISPGQAGVIQELQQFVAPLIGGAFQDKQASKRLLWAASKRRK